jgi:hypothetical protein
LKEGRRLKIFKFRMLSNIFRPNRYEMAGYWRKFHYEDPHDSYYSPSKRLIRWVLHVSCMGVRTDAHRVLMGKSEGKRPLGKPRRI